MLDIQSYHKKDSDSDCEGIFKEVRQRGKVEYGPAGKADQMATYDISCLRGDAGGHCEYDKGSGTHCADYDGFFLAQDKNKNKQGKGGQ